jgi:putative heme-binding domain-containing protein
MHVRFSLMMAIVAMVFAFADPVLAQPKPAGKGIEATPAGQLKVAKGFKVERLYSVPKEKEGSWVCMTTLPDGRLIVSDQYDKGMYVVTPPPIGTTSEPKVEPLDLKFEGKLFGAAQGLCWAFDALYVVVNQGKASGLYRVTDSDNDGKLDKIELLRNFIGHGDGGLGEHGPHAVMKHPDGKRLTVVCGNQTMLTKYDKSAVPENWGEDHLLPRLPDGNGFMAGINGPGGAMYNVTPDGKTWELHCVGFRNQYDAAYNRDGDLITYDADMEWDVNTPWYRPTRVCLAVRGGEFGWRNGAGKYPAYYPDNLPAIVDIGPGSPTGVVFGYGAKFPAKYQDAYFICDWSYGKMYAVHLTPEGASYKGVAEEFISGSPLPLTDLVVSEKDGAMYFATGGRRVQSGLYRVTYTGTEDIKPSAVKPRARPTEYTFQDKDLFRARAGLEAEIGNKYERLAGVASDYLKSPDRTLRFVARATNEHMLPGHRHDEEALESKDPNTVIATSLMLVRSSASCPQHDKDRKKKGDPKLGAQILTALGSLDFTKLTAEQRIDLTRVYHVLFNRFGPPTESQRAAWLAKYEPAFPTGQRFVDGELLQVFVYLQGPNAAAKGVKLLAEAPTQEEQMEYARALRMLKAGWTPELRKPYFEWFVKAQTYKGGNSFTKFVLMMKADAVKTLSDAEKVVLQPILDAKPATTTEVVPTRAFVKKHTLDDLAPKLEKAISAGGRDFDKGRKLFAAANCFSCHRYDSEGGSVGPDLTGVSGRFSQKDLLESVLDPSKEVSDQYQAVSIDTLDGKKVTGRIVNLNGDNINIMVNMLDPNKMVTVNQANVDRITPSKTSMMPTGTLDTLTDDEVYDLMAYMLSRGDRKHPAFRK